jgi:general stress protein 26
MAGLSDWGRTLLEGRHYATLATQNADGTLHQAPVWYLFRDEQLFVGTSSFTHKFKNVTARPTASLLVDVRTPGVERWIAGSGPVSILRGAESQAIVAAIHERYLTAEARQDPAVGPIFAGGDDVTLCIQPAKWRSWQAADLDRQFFGGVLAANPSKYFRSLD